MKKMFLFVIGILFVGSLSGKAKDYSMQALKKHVDVLVKAEQKGFNTGSVVFRNRAIRNCAQKIKSQGNFKPLVALWKSSQLQENKNYISEFAALVFMSYQSALTRCIDCPQQRNIWEAIVALYGKLGVLPTDKLFDVLDECFVHYTTIVQDYDTGEALTTASWIKSNWWIPATTVLFVSLSFLRWYKLKKSGVSGPSTTTLDSALSA